MNPHACCYVLLTLGLAGALVGGLGLLNYQVDHYNRLLAICDLLSAIGDRLFRLRPPRWF